MFQWAGFSEAELANLCIVIHNVVVWWCGERTEFGGRVLFVENLLCVLPMLFIHIIDWLSNLLFLRLFPTQKSEGFCGGRKCNIEHHIILDFDS